MEAGTLFLDRGESLIAKWHASMWREYTARELRAVNRGVNIHLMRGVTCRIGGSTGRATNVGEEVREADSGTLYVTTRRLIFTGCRTTMSLPLCKILGLTKTDEYLVVSASSLKRTWMLKLDDVPSVIERISSMR